jgi:hypothetical protein
LPIVEWRVSCRKFRKTFTPDGLRGIKESSSCVCEPLLYKRRIYILQAWVTEDGSVTSSSSVYGLAVIYWKFITLLLVHLNSSPKESKLLDHGSCGLHVVHGAVEKEHADTK